MTGAEALSEHLRGHKRDIAAVWEAKVRAELSELRPLDAMGLIDHLPEFIDGLAAWTESSSEVIDPAFGSLLEGHALQRLNYGIDLVTVTREYALLRSTVLHELMSVPTTDSIREPLTRVNEGMDAAIHAAVRRYTHVRDQVRDRFVGILAHDLRTPLGAIAMGAAQIMATSAGPEDKHHRLGTMINRSAERMTRMIEDVIEFARGHLGGGIPVTLTPGDLGEIVREAVDEVRLAHPERAIALEMSGTLVGVWDRDRVLQLVSNLVGNAMQHGEDPTTIGLHENADRTALILTVNSHGPVIAADRLRHLFDPLRIETRKTRRGLGLGLYIVRQIALSHGARCEVTSDETSGTTFTVHWPRSPQNVPQRQ
jgi:signal transduction histidine kinase